MSTGRGFQNANNPSFSCADSVLLLPFGRRSYLPAIVESLQGEEVALDETTDRIVYQLRGSSTPLTLVYSGMGGPAAANAVEMAVANGARRLVLFGACGGVVPEVELGDLIAVSGAVRGEGTSGYYAPPAFPALFSPTVTARLWEEAGRREVRGAHCGVVFTTDAGYRQGPEIYQEHRGLVLGVESECAAVAVVSARLGLEAAAILFCTDNATLREEEDRAYRGLRDPRVRRGFDHGLETAVAVLADLAELEALKSSVAPGLGSGAVGVVVVDHGSRREESNDALLDVVRAFTRSQGFEIVEPAHMDLAEPSVATAFGRCVERGAQEIVVMPFFLLPGRHCEVDIPTLVEDAARLFPGVRTVVTTPLGGHELIPRVMASRIRRCLQCARGAIESCPQCGDEGGEPCKFLSHG